MSKSSENPAWKSLAAHALRMSERHLRDLFVENPKRSAVFSVDLGDIYVDFSRERIDTDVLAGLLALAEAADVPAFLGRMLSGGMVNESERRSALHAALRGSGPKELNVDGHNIRGEIARVDARVRNLIERIAAGEIKGYGGKIDTVLVLGIGGSEYGPAFVLDALQESITGPRVRFVGNIDGVTLDRALAGVDPSRTLAVLISKSFETTETKLNWAALKARHPKLPALAVTANILAARQAGFADGDVFPIWDWVGGRYSLWSAVGLPIALALGWPAFEALRAGAAEMDRHLLTAPVRENAPLLMGLIGVWNATFLGARSRAVIPYDSRLSAFIPYLQQLEMESNGKNVTQEGETVGYPTAPVRFGAVGTNAQHTFFQMLHQGTDMIPVDFLVPAVAATNDAGLHPTLLVNALAQADALMAGRPDVPKDQPYRAFGGNRPSTVVLYGKLDARVLGKLIALYEHRTAVEGALWDVNSFDQWGVELGKKMAVEIEPMLKGEKKPTPSLAALIARLGAFGKDAG